MKTKIKRHSRSVISVLLAVCMLISCMTVGLIATDAAKTDSEAVCGTAWEDAGKDWAFIYSNWTTTSNGTSTGCKPDSTWHQHANMTWNSDQSQFEHTFVLKSNTSYQFKIKSGLTNNDGNWYGQASSSDWLGAYASANCGIKKDGNNIPLVTMNADSGWVTVKIMAKPGDMRVYVTQTAVTAETLKISGSMTGWKNYNDSSSVTMTKAGNGIYTYTFTSLAAKTGTDDDDHRHRFTILDSNEWNRASNEGVTYGSSTTVTKDTATVSNEGMTDVSGQSTKFQLSSASDVTITYDYVNNTLNIRGANSYDYYITSAGATDDDKGFTDNIWDVDDPDGGMTETSSGSKVYSATFNSLPVGTYRFKVTDGTWTNSYGDDTHVNYMPSASFKDCNKDNSGNACFTLTKASNITITFDSNHISDSSSTNPMLTVSATDVAVPEKYYVVGQASDGTRGMFSNVWANDWTTFNSADEITVDNNVGSKVYTDFAGTTGTYTYKVIKVTSDGIAQYFPESGDGQTVNVTSRTSSVTFAITTDESGDILTATATPVEGSASSDATYDPIFNKSNNEQTNNQWHLLTSTTQDGLVLNDSAVVSTVYKNNDYYFKIKVSELNGTSNEFIAVSIGTDPSSIVSGSTNKTVTVASRATDYLDAGGQGSTYGSQQRQFSWVKFKNSTAASSFNYIVLKFNNSSYSYTYDVYGDGSSGGDTTTVASVDIYAKNGTLRDNTFNRFTNLANTDIISITDPDGIVHTSTDWATASATWNGGTAGSWENDKQDYNSNYAKVTAVPIGSKVKLRTYLSGDTTADQIYQSGKSFAQTHYLKAYSINGMTYQLHTASEAKTATTGYKFNSSDKYYEEEWTVEAINTTNMKNGKTVEITPIYYLTDNSNTKTFYIDGYIGDLQTKWGTMLTVYPYYEGKSNKANAFGGYPGQPMLYWGGKYQMEIPLTVDGTASGAQVKGLTMHNGYWDLLHRALDTKCADSHCQTYDYDDFYKLYKEKNADTIYFWFKYRNRSANDNFGDGYEYTDYDFVTDTEGVANIGSTPTITTIEGKNGAEIITDYYGRQVSLFGDLINDDDKSTYVGDSPALKGNELLIVSTGYKDTYVGEYGTIWAVYTQPSKGNFNFLGYISSSMLYLNSINSVNQYTGGTSTDQGRMSWSEFKNTYNTLKSTYKNVPAIISYEKEIWNDSKDKAYRSDGKWFYSMGNDKITANIKIQYTDSSTATLMDKTANWTDDSFSESVTGFAGEHNVGTTTGCSAYFTNTTPEYLVGKTKAEDILVDNNKHFTFQAANGGTYEFVGWVRECGGEKNAIASTNGLGESNISANDTYIARFKPVSTGKLVISHNITQDATHKGNGTKYLKVQVYDGTTLKKEYVSTDGSDVDVSDFIKSTTSGYKIKVTLSTVPDEDCTVVARTCSPDTFATDAITNPQAGVTVTQTKEFLVSEVFNGTTSTVTAIRYLTALTKTQMTYNYAITYHYTSRFWGNQSYYVSGTVADERYSAQFFTGTKSGARLTDEFIKNSTPYEKNFRQKINWNYTDSAVNGAAAMTKGCSTSTANVYDLTAEVWSSNTVNDEVKAEFLLPYKYVSDTKSAAPLPVYTAGGTVTENTEYAFDEDSYESFTLTSQVGRLFQYDNTVPEVAHASDHASQYKLVEAAPYVLYKSYDSATGKITPVDFHHKKVSSKRYYTGNSFTVKKNGSDVTYYLNAVPDGAPAGSQALTVSNTVTVNKPEKVGQEGYNGTTYDFAVQADDGRVYFFAYAMNDDDTPKLVDGKFVFNGQYIVYSENDVIDGIVQGDYVKKYFTRWDIFNSNGVKVASSYYRQFNYSGYENYTIKPVYTSDEPTAATFDENEGSDGIAATISYLGDSRNQWKGSSESDTTAGGNYSSVTNMSDATYAGDKLFADFAIAYNYNDQQLSTISKVSETIKIGMVIEKLGEVQTVNGKVVTDPNYYQGLAAYNQFDVEDMQNYILSKVATGHEYTGRPNSVAKNYDGNPGSSHGVTHVAIGSNENGFAGDNTTTLLFGEGTPMLDNKNRLQYFYTFTKSANGVENTTTRPVNHVYRVSSYIYVASGTNETVRVSAPIYITLYDTATR